jgi:hypothetical protein
MDIRHSSRRTFLLGSLATAASALVVTSSSVAHASTTCGDTTTVWTLNPQWGYPAGQHGRTACQCSACVSHAANKLFASQNDALDMAQRAHPGCLCVPESHEVAADTYDALFASTSVVDRRWSAVAQILSADTSCASVGHSGAGNDVPNSGDPSDPLVSGVGVGSGVGLGVGSDVGPVAGPVDRSGKVDTPYSKASVDVDAETETRTLPNSGGPGLGVAARRRIAEAQSAVSAAGNASTGASAGWPLGSIAGVSTAGVLGLGGLAWLIRRRVAVAAEVAAQRTDASNDGPDVPVP